MQLSRQAFFHPRRGFLAASSCVVLASLASAMWLSNFPHNRATLWLLAPALAACAATIGTLRCIRPRWSFYHAGVVLCLYMDLMVVAIILFLFIYPYTQT